MMALLLQLLMGAAVGAAVCTFTVKILNKASLTDYIHKSEAKLHKKAVASVIKKIVEKGDCKEVFLSTMFEDNEVVTETISAEQVELNHGKVIIY